MTMATNTLRALTVSHYEEQYFITMPVTSYEQHFKFNSASGQPGLALDGGSEGPGCAWLRCQRDTTFRVNKPRARILIGSSVLKESVPDVVR